MCVNNALISIPSVLPEAAPACREFKYLQGIPSSEERSAPLRASAGKKEKIHTNCEEFNGSSTWSALSKACGESDGRPSTSPRLMATLEGCSLR